MSKIEILKDVATDILIPCPKNIFSHEFNLSDIIASIRDFGYNKVSIGMDEENILLYGHGTLDALKILGWKIVPMVARISGLDNEQKRAYRIADNTTAFRSVILKELLKEETDRQTKFDFANYGMPISELLDAGAETPGELQDTSEKFSQDNPDIPKKEKMWMYIEFNTLEDWERAIAFMGLRSSRRVLDEIKFMEILNEKEKI